MSTLTISPEMAISLTSFLNGVLDNANEEMIEKITIDEYYHIIIRDEVKENKLLKVTVYLKPYSDGVTD